MEWIDIKKGKHKLGVYLCVKYSENGNMFFVGTYFHVGDRGLWFCDDMGNQIYVDDIEYCYWLKED